MTGFISSIPTIGVHPCYAGPRHGGVGACGSWARRPMPRPCATGMNADGWDQRGWGWGQGEQHLRESQGPAWGPQGALSPMEIQRPLPSDDPGSWADAARGGHQKPRSRRVQFRAGKQGHFRAFPPSPAKKLGWGGASGIRVHRPIPAISAAGDGRGGLGQRQGRHRPTRPWRVQAGQIGGTVSAPFQVSVPSAEERERWARVLSRRLPKDLVWASLFRSSNLPPPGRNPRVSAASPGTRG